MNGTLERKSLSTDLAARPRAVAGVSAAAALVLMLVPWLWPLNYPFRLLVTIVHELSHGIAALLTGGAFLRFVVSPDGAGTAYTAGGWRLLVIPAGYLGAALFGSLLMLLGRSQRWSRVALGAIGAVVLLLSLRYGVPSIFSSQIGGGLVAVLSGSLLGAAFLFAAKRATPLWVLFLTNLVALQAGLTAFSDLFNLVGISSRFTGDPATDARSMAELTYIPAAVWAAVWVVFAAVVLGLAAWRAWRNPHF